MIKLKRFGGNPILRPNIHNQWESNCVYNPAAIYHDGLFHMLYRAMGTDNISRIGYAVSRDGFDFYRLDKPVFSPELIEEPKGCEDPRVVYLDGKFYMTYTAYSDKGTRIGLASTQNFIAWERYSIEWPEVDNKDAVLFPEKIDNKYIMYHRPMNQDPMGIWIAYSEDLIHWHEQKEIMVPEYKWENNKIGASPPPLKTEIGWLLFYHGVDQNAMYQVGVALFDLNRPDRLIGRYPHSIFEPQERYELQGLIPNVVFPCGAVEYNGNYYIYYGAADKVIGVAIADKKEILDLFK